MRIVLDKVRLSSRVSESIGVILYAAFITTFSQSIYKSSPSISMNIVTNFALLVDHLLSNM